MDAAFFVKELTVATGIGSYMSTDTRFRASFCYEKTIGEPLKPVLDYRARETLSVQLKVHNNREMIRNKPFSPLAIESVVF